MLENTFLSETMLNYLYLGVTNGLLQLSCGKVSVFLQQIIKCVCLCSIFPLPLETAKAYVKGKETFFLFSL